MDIKNKQVLGLQLPTDPRWVNLAEISLESILTDHAFCEMKAASSCMSLIQLYPHLDKLVEELMPIVTEEWGHFRMVIAELKKRNLKLGGQRKDTYVHGLLKFIPKGTSKEERLLDRLLMFGLIEARSCERFRLLSQELKEPELQKFYHVFMVSEAGHYKTFLALAREYHEEELVWKRWKEWLAYEKELLHEIGVRGDRMH